MTQAAEFDVQLGGGDEVAVPHYRLPLLQPWSTTRPAMGESRAASRTEALTALDGNERSQIAAVIMRHRNRMDAPVPAFRAAIDDAKMISAGQRWGNRTSVNSHS